MPPFDANEPNQGRFSRRAGADNGTRGAIPAPTVLTSAPTPAGLFQCLQRRFVSATLVGLLVGGLAAGAVWVFAPEAKHTVRTTLRVPVGKGAFGLRAGDAPDNLVNHQRTHVALVKNRAVLNKALSDPEVAKLASVKEMEPTAALEWLESQVQADFSIAPEILRISMRGHETSELATIVEAVRKAYLEETVENELQRQIKTRDNLANLIKKYDQKLKDHRASHQAVLTQAGPKEGNHHTLLIAFQGQMLSATQTELLRTRSALKEAQSKVENLEKRAASNTKAGDDKPAQPGPGVDPVILSEKIKGHPGVALLTLKLDSLEAKKVEVLRVAKRGKEEKAYALAEKEALETREQLARLTTEVGAKALKELEAAAKLGASSTLFSLRQEVDRLKLLEETLKKEEGHLRERVAAQNAAGAQAEMIREDNSVTEKMLAHLRTQKENLDVILDAGKPVDLLEARAVQRVDDTTRRAMLTAGTGLGMFAFCLLGLAWLEFRTRKVASADDVVLGLGMRLVGTLPSSRRAKSATAPGGSKTVPSVSQQVLTESVDAARTTLLHLARSHSLRTVMVTSAVAAEGKTSLTCHLAASLSRAGLRVLLIDADMRNPSAHRLFGLKCEVGFSEVLCGKVAPEDCIQETSLRNLALLPAGRWTDSTAAALNQGRAAGLFEQFRQQYDLIIVDSSPVLPVADSLLLAQQVDGVILSVLCNVSRLNDLYAAWQRVRDHGGQPLGVVINGVSSGTYGASYAYPYPRKPKAKA